MPLEATDPCKIGAMGSTPMRSTFARMIRKVARYGSRGRSAKPRDAKVSCGFESHAFRWMEIEVKVAVEREMRISFYSLLTPFYSPSRLHMAFAFEKLVVYQQAVDFVDDICSQTEQFRRGYGFIGNQLNRAALSISMNIAEGNGRFTVPDRKHFFGIARGSVHECVPLLELAARRKLLPVEEQQSLKARLEEISKMLSGLIKSLDDSDFRNERGRESREE